MCARGFKDNLASACSVSAKSTRTGGRSAGIVISTGCEAKVSRSPSSAAFTFSRLSRREAVRPPDHETFANDGAYLATAFGCGLERGCAR